MPPDFPERRLKPHEIVPRPAIDEIGTVFARKRIVGRAPDDDVVPRPTSYENRTSPPADEDVGPVPALRHFDLGLGQIERHAARAHPLHDVGAADVIPNSVAV